jgi:hypothetical protein
MPKKNTKTFKLKDFVRVDPNAVDMLEAVGVKNTAQMLSAGRTVESRDDLAKKAGISRDVVLELVKLSDLARIPGVKGIRARLYYEAGVDTVKKLAACEAESLLKMTTEFVERSGFPGIAPLPKEVSSTIESAKRLPNIVEW